MAIVEERLRNTDAEPDGRMPVKVTHGTECSGMNSEGSGGIERQK